MTPIEKIEFFKKKTVEEIAAKKKLWYIFSDEVTL